MSAATDYTENNIINALFRGQAFAQATTLYIALHTGDPGETGGQNEVQTATWPSYTRQDAAQGGNIETGWTEQGDGSVTNAKQIIYPVYDGASSLQITHYSVKDAATGGNNIIKGAFSTAQTLTPGNVFVIDANKLTAQVS